MTSFTQRLDLVERNLIINGNMDFSQRGTSISANNVAKYTADRFQLNTSAAFTVTYTQSTDVPTQAQSGFQSRYSALYTNGTGSASTTDDVYIEYKLEGQDYQPIHGRRFRLQFWVKSSVSGTYGLALRQPSGARSYVTTYSIASANTWQLVTLDLPADTVGGYSFDNTAGLAIDWSLAMTTALSTTILNIWQSANVLSSTSVAAWGASTGATFQLAQVMLIPQDFTQAGAGNVVIPFQRCGRSIGHELQMCQRYYELMGGNQYFPGAGGPSVGTVFFATEKRSAGYTVTTQGDSSSASGVSGTNTMAYTVTGLTNNFNGTIGCFTRGFYLLCPSGSTSATIHFSWTVDNEL